MQYTNVPAKSAWGFISSVEKKMLFDLNWAECLSYHASSFLLVDFDTKII